MSPDRDALPSSRDPRRLVVFGVVAGASAVLLLWMLYQVRSILVLAYVSGLFAMGLAPLVQLIERQRIVPIGTQRLPRWLAILAVYAAFLGSLTLLVMAVVPPLIQQADELWRALPQRLQQAQEWLVRVGVLQEPVTLGDAVQQAPGGGGPGLVGTVVGAVRNVVGGVFGIVTMLLLTFYMLVESRETFAFFVRLFPPQDRPRVAAVCATVVSKVSAWLGAQLFLAFVIGVTSAIGLYLMGVPYFYVLALISAVGEMIPMIGPILAAIPAILVAATVSPTLALGVVLFFIVQQQLENNVLVPKVMGRQVGLSPVMIIISLAMGAQLYGIIGAILAVPTAAIVQVLFNELVARDA